MNFSLLVAASVVAVSGCSYNARSPEVYRDDTKALLATKNAEIRACYNGVLKSTPDAAGRVTIKFEVDTEAGRIVNVEIDKTKTTAPEAVCECVTKHINGLGLAPPDRRMGQATFVWEFASKR